jgi:GT2 family glycosyltransferase
MKPRLSTHLRAWLIGLLWLAERVSSEKLHRLVLRIVRRELARDFRVESEPLTFWLDAGGREAREWLAELRLRPRISIVTPVCDPEPAALERCLASVMDQVYRNWELCVVDDASKKPDVRRVLERAAAKDARIRLVTSPENQGGAAAANMGLEMARGEFCGVLDHDDLLHPEALFEYVRALNRQPAADLLYCDEDKLDASGRHVDPWHKSDWNPDLSLSFNYVMHFALYRRRLLDELGGFRPDYEGSHDYDLLLRTAERTDEIHHIPRILYHWRMSEASIARAPEAKPYVFESGLAALRDALDRRKISGEAQDAPHAWKGVYRVRRRIVGEPRTSLVIAFRGDAPGLARTLASALGELCADRREILVCGAPELEERYQSVASELRAAAVWLPSPGAGSLPQIFNRGSRGAAGDFLCFLDDQMAFEEGAHEALLEHAQRSEVGAVGGKLLHPDDRVEHAGVIGGPFGLLGYANRNTIDEPGYLGLSSMIGNYSAVLGLGMMLRRKTFEGAGGFDEDYVREYWDVDFCLRLGEQGLRITFTPYARLRHYVPVRTLEEMVSEPDATRFRARWQSWIDRDPFFNPNFSREREDFLPVQGA